MDWPPFIETWRKAINDHIADTGHPPDRLRANEEDETEYHRVVGEVYQRIPLCGPRGGILFKGIEVFPAAPLERGECEVVA